MGLISGVSSSLLLVLINRGVANLSPVGNLASIDYKMVALSAVIVGVAIGLASVGSFKLAAGLQE